MERSTRQKQRVINAETRMVSRLDLDSRKAYTDFRNNNSKPLKKTGADNGNWPYTLFLNTQKCQVMEHPIA
jgi:chloramphenicol O-acetyltransferase